MSSIICAIMIISGFSTFAATKRKKLSNVLCGLRLFGHCEINCLFYNASQVLLNFSLLLSTLHSEQC